MSYRLRSRPPATGGSAPVRFQSGNSRDFAVNAGHRRHPLARQKRRICSDIARCTKSRVLLAMQKVEGSNPFSRSRKGLQLQAVFVCAVGWCVCVAGYSMGTRRPTRGGSDSEQARLQAFPDDSNH
jgi:hypothetical protein